MVTDGWFSSGADIFRIALLEFLHSDRLELIERFQREDIPWALRQRDTAEESVILNEAERSKESLYFS